MPDFKDFPRVGRIVGFDWGARRTGVAVCDETRQFVFARAQIVASNSEDMAEKIIDCINAENFVGVVFGLPLRTDGTESDTTKMVRNAVNVIEKRTNLPICFIDEVLTSSSAAAENKFHSIKDVKEKLDSESARIILENAISVISRQ